ncbi:glycoside hydrolase family 5 protein [Agaribacterium haliotis]|uniref:glycoside hydrolase family 5 protein n=1 Tax=Agaribacterium haliotis TaxID=2013869 RepID=UPI000BB59C4F|nr:cellulase family glycosylhydrolase [Agaribacterium haliotis]
MFIRYSSALLLCLSFIFTPAIAKDVSAKGQWWFKAYPEKFDDKDLTNYMSAISVKGNKFVDEKGQTVVFRGMNLSDPDKLKKNGHWKEKHFKEAASWGANIVRFPIHPISWRYRGKEKYLELLDDGVRWANKYNMYVIFDWHSMGSIFDGVYQHEMYETDAIETRRFWQAIAFRYEGVNTVAFYELFNEPTDGDGRFGKLNWPQWKQFNESLIDIIQSYDSNVVSLVAGFDWAYDLSAARGDLIDRPNVAYVSHPYPQKAEGPKQQQLWEEKWGFITQSAPLMATEIGWMKDGERGAHYPVIDNEHIYGPAIIDYLEGKGASWVAWVFDPDWTPNMYEGWKYEATEQGRFFKKTMLELNKP